MATKNFCSEQAASIAKIRFFLVLTEKPDFVLSVNALCLIRYVKHVDLVLETEPHAGAAVERVP